MSLTEEIQKLEEAIERKDHMIKVLKETIQELQDVVTGKGERCENRHVSIG